VTTGFVTALALHHFDHNTQILIETDASNYVPGGVLSQSNNYGDLHPAAYFSKQHTPMECTYDIYGKKLTAIIIALEEWIPECEGAANSSQLITDHENLEYFMTKKLLNRRQA
jgi:hypothetical protein